MADLIDRNTLLLAMKAQEIDHELNAEAYAEPSWQLAIDMIKQIPAAKEEE